MQQRFLRAWVRALRIFFSIPSADLRAALPLAWLVVSLALAVALAAALVMPAHAILAVAARCETPAGHRVPCALCGMTHAFLAWREGDVRGAVEANPGSAVLFPLLALNEAAMAFVLIRRMRPGRTGRACPAGGEGAPVRWRR